MTRVLLMLVLTVAGFAAAAWTAWHPEVWEPTLERLGLGPGTIWYTPLVRGFAGLVAALPAIALLNAILRLGRDGGSTDIHGYTVLRLRSGARWFYGLATIALAALFLSMPLIDPGNMPWVFRGAAAVVLVFGLVLVTATVRYDNRTLSVATLFGARHYDWADLEDIREERRMGAMLLLFRNGRTASISRRYAGLEAMLETARARMDAHAGASRGRDRPART
jgi:hypothetical protein